MATYWLIFAFILLVAEMLTPTFFLFWFAIGAIVTCIVAVFVPNIYVQVAVFSFVSIILLIFTKSLVKKFMKSETNIKSNVDALIGKKAKVIETITSDDVTGKIKVNGEIWKAIPEEENTVFEKGSEVIICAVDGVKLIVKGGN